jgi:outer membrane protein assembly factor BamB
MTTANEDGKRLFAVAVDLQSGKVLHDVCVFTMVNDSGIASCVEAKTGQVVWHERIGGQYSASPVYADGRIYCPSQEGKTTVLRPGRRCEVLAVNRLDDGFMASPAVVGGALVLRTKTHLYRIEKP